MYNLPNLLTISRIAVIPLVFLSVYFDCRFYTYFAGILFISASITDYYDGKLARARGEVSAFGRLLDPIADKLLVAAALVVFLAKPNMLHPISYIPVFVILCRELLVSGLREFLREVNVGLPVTRLAKWKTGFQMTALSMILMSRVGILEIGGTYVPVWGVLGEVLLWVAGVLTFITGYDYFKKSLDYVRSVESEKAVLKAPAKTAVKAEKAGGKKVVKKSPAKKKVSKKSPAKAAKTAAK